MADLLPSADDMAGLDAENYFFVLEKYAVLPPMPVLRAQAGAYVSRMTQYPPGGPGWQRELDNLVSTESKRGMLGVSRRLSERWSTLETIDGNEQQQGLLWLFEDDEASCDNCAVYAGQIHSYAKWESMGISPGSSVCKGGESCRCDRIAVD
ncbi:MAG: hypothetical protein GY854_19810 [Deltaproteobacteria bacterium]|nr:hypothetical protein [Deltaproteobacteria bacterium]